MKDIYAQIHGKYIDITIEDKDIVFKIKWCVKDSSIEQTCIMLDEIKLCLDKQGLAK